MSKIKIVEVSLRDGLQNEKLCLNLKEKIQIVKKLVSSGLRRIEIGSFVSLKRVPQLADTYELVKKVNSFQKRGEIPKTVEFSALVPNMKGLERALSSGIKEIAIFTACSDSFCLKNINCTVKESFWHFKQVVKVAKQNGMKVRGYLSVSFGCPYEGRIQQRNVISSIKKLLDLGVYEVSLGDTIGVANPSAVETLIEKIDQNKIPSQKIALHFHDTRGIALANILKSYECGIRTFDSSVGGLGGCPYAKGSAGNVATEDVVYMLQSMKKKINIDLKKLVSITHQLEKLFKKTLPSRISKVI